MKIVFGGSPPPFFKFSKNSAKIQQKFSENSAIFSTKFSENSAKIQQIKRHETHIIK